MKTNRHLISRLSKATLIFTLVFSSLVSVSCQKTASQSFQYKADFIKQMVYKISNEFFTRADDQVVSVKYWGNENSAVTINYSVSDKHVNDASVVNEKELEDFLTRAAQFNSPVAEVEVEKDITLEFLINAAQLNTPETFDENNTDSDLLDFLTQAAQLNDYVTK